MVTNFETESEEGAGEEEEDLVNRSMPRSDSLDECPGGRS